MVHEFKYIAEISEKTFAEENVLLFLNEEGMPCIFIKNSRSKTCPQKGRTDNIEYQLNSVIYKDEKPYYVHKIVCLKNDEYSREQFAIVYEYLFGSVLEPKSDFEIHCLLNSLESFFKITPEKDLLKIQTGIYGELLFVLFAYERGAKDILSKYHRDFYSKHDLELDEKNRIEIKTSVGDKRIHHFSHDQLVRRDLNVFVVSILLEKSSEGVTLKGLFDKVHAIAVESDQVLWFGNLKGLCGVSSVNEGPAFSWDKAIQDIRFYRSEALPHLETTIPNGVTGVSYDVDCSMAEPIGRDAFIAEIQELLAKNKE